MMSFWQLTDNQFAELNEALRSSYGLGPSATGEQVLTVLDDCEWQLWHAGLVLLRSADQRLQLYRGRQPMVSDAAGARCRFWWQLPDGELAQQLKPLVGVRAFVPQFSCRLRSETCAVLNDEEKTVARLHCYSLIENEGELSGGVEIEPLRGYQEDLRLIETLLENIGALKKKDFPLRELLLAGGLQPVALITKPVFNLQAEEVAEMAVLRMAAELIAVARGQENGIREDIDSEFVHQYRVSIRKTRSLISLFKKSLGPERYQLLKRELKAIGSATNILRDLDVFLLAHDYYCSLLPDDLQPGLEQLFARIRRRRVRVLRQVVSRLAGDDYAEQMGELQQSLQAPAHLETEQARQPLKTLVEKKVHKQYRRICRDGAAITADSADETVHRLRIECKKLRYLLELFAELFPKKQLKQLIGWLKKLQDNLGRFNDYAVQQQFLRQSGQGTQLAPEQLAAINGLIAVLYNQQQAERVQVEANIAVFSAEPVTHQFEKLFPPGGRRAE